MKLKIGYLFIGLLLAACTANAQQGPPSGQQPPQPPSREARLKQVSNRLEKDLGLKPDQKQKVVDAYGKFFDGIEKLRGGQPGPPPPPPPPPGKREDIEKLAKARDESIKKTLTDAQFKKYQEIEKTMRPGGPGRPGGPPTPPPAG
ncbi:MAG: hypothetical protein H7289_14215 [Mucilaginibacter sp.]|nr:hypothetical protein [Mucilaginibacter sp.]